ncbi:MAG: hypothetical protein IT580_24090, partial [Verrucomicrobiales bacterium]|nr:hypothetical protein [Verrucomicrobiales bacterium]
AAATGSTFLNLLLTPFAMIAFVAVFLLGHVINVLILVSPFTTVDLGLKSLRAALLATVVGTSFVNPTFGALWSLLIILVGLVLFGWSFRISVLGAVFLWDVFSRRRRWFAPKPEGNWIFLARSVDGAPVRTLGRLVRSETGELRFQYRPLLLGRRGEVTLPRGEYCVGRGFIYADLLRREGEETSRYGILPPRYKGHEETFTGIYQLAPPQDVGLRAIWAGIKELFGFGRPASSRVSVS